MLQRECQSFALHAEKQSLKYQMIVLSSSVCTVDIDFISSNLKSMVSFSVNQILSEMNHP
mgnify:FL=1